MRVLARRLTDHLRQAGHGAAAISFLLAVIACAFAHGSIAAADVEPALGTKAKLLLDEKFDRESLPNTWTLKSGQLRVAAGILRAGRTKDTDRLCLFNLEQPLQDAAIQIDFRFDGASGINVSVNPSPGELNKHGHLFSVMITQRMWNITEHNDKSDRNSRSKALASAAERFESGKWYTLLVETRGDDVVAQVAGRKPLRASSKDFRVKKPGIEFRVAGAPDQEVSFDNLMVWELKAPDAPPPSRPAAPATLPARAAVEAPRAAGLQIQIASHNPVRINPKIYGINCAEMFIFDLVQKPEYLSALGDLQLNTFLFPGGSTYHHPTGTGGFNIRQEEIAKSRHGTDHRINKQGSPDFFLQYLDFMKPMSGRAVFIPNIANGTVDELDYYMKKMTEAGVPIASVVLGMEVQLGAYRFPDAAAYVKAISPYVDYLKSRYPAVRIAAWSTPVGRRAAVPDSFHQWNREVAKVPGIDGFAQYGWTEFGGAAIRRAAGGEPSGTPEQHLKEYDAFVENFPTRQIEPYAGDWSKERKMFMLQWGTHADRNLVVEGLHMVNFYFFMTQYNATHDNYFEVATWSAPMAQDLSSGRGRNRGAGMLYKKDIALWTPYLYAKPLRYFYSGDKALLRATAMPAPKNGTMQLVKVIAAAGPDGKKYICVLNRGPTAALGEITIDGKVLPPETPAYVESVSGESLSATAATLKIFAGNNPIGSVSIGAYGVTTLILP